MLAYIDTGREQVGLFFLRDLADKLAQAGLCVRGAVRVEGGAARARQDMRLRVLGCATGGDIVISQDLGEHASGCRLDPGALESAAARTVAAIDGADLVIVNKFGKQEAFGRGMRSVIATAIERGLPVLTLVDAPQRDDFLGFAGDFAQIVTAAEAESWCKAAAQTVPAA
ncbi:MAG: DUF2478 domain-containing protein [Paracoccus sp. (in: a-proteobacteria)]|nr:DUF2478 domain-containing protein [Paracoccus sp. (in: a-proteobacteria)]